MRSNLPKEVLIIGGTTVLVGVPMMLLANKVFKKQNSLSVIQLTGVMFATGDVYKTTTGGSTFLKIVP